MGFRKPLDSEFGQIPPELESPLSAGRIFAQLECNRKCELAVKFRSEGNQVSVTNEELLEEQRYSTVNARATTSAD